MSFPRFLIADNTDFPEDVFIVHTEYPRFILKLSDDQVEWLEEFSAADQKELESEAETLIREATDFYDREISRYES